VAVVTILGAGAMGSALTIPLSDRGHEVRLWFTEFDVGILREVSERKPHPRLGIRLPEGVKLYPPEKLEEAVSGADYVVVAVSSRGVLPVSRKLRGLLDSRVPVVVVAKGVEVVEGRPRTMTDIVEEYAGSKSVVYVSGPSLAAELARRVPTFVVYSSRDLGTALKVKQAFETEYYRIEVSDDVLGAELSAALKNVYAIAFGIVRGLCKADSCRNLEASVLSYALAEIAKVIEACGGKRETAYSLSGVGDLYVTAMGGRNSAFGALVGGGLSPREALEEMRKRGVGVVEGYLNAPTLASLLSERGVGRDVAPLFYAVYDVLYEGAEPTIIVNTLTARA